MGVLVAASHPAKAKQQGWPPHAEGVPQQGMASLAGCRLRVAAYKTDMRYGQKPAEKEDQRVSMGVDPQRKRIRGWAGG